MPSLPIEERLLHYFLAMGAQQAEPTQSAQGSLSLALGSEKIHVVILEKDTLAQRNRIIDTILGLASLRTPTTHLYLAAPKLLGAIIDAAMFRSHGIGLILYDERRIEEAVAPQPLQVPQQVQTSSGPDPAFITELTNLRSMYLEMERTIAKLREDLTTFQETLGKSSNDKVLEVSHPERRAAVLPGEPIFASPGAQLPSFFTNNPWLDVLSKRGRAEDEPIAG